MDLLVRDMYASVTAGWRPAVEIFILATLLYAVFSFLRDARSAAVLRGAFFAWVGALAILMIASQALGLHHVTWSLVRLLALAAIGVFIVFQPEIRRGFVRLGQGAVTNLFARNRADLVDEVVTAIAEMAKNKIGGLVAIQRDVDLDDFMEGGVTLEAHLSSQLIVSLFMPASPLHDGAVILRRAKVAAAGCLLPLTDNPDVSKTLGTRHRAGIGLTEVTDAVTLIVSENTGRISVGVRGELMQGLSVEDLRGILRRLCAEADIPALHSI